jgi:hypothetical protein
MMMESFDGEEKSRQARMLEPSPSRGLPLASSVLSEQRDLGMMLCQSEARQLSRWNFIVIRSWTRHCRWLLMKYNTDDGALQCKGSAAHRLKLSVACGEMLQLGASQQLAARARHEVTAPRPTPCAASLATSYLTCTCT